MKLGPVDNGWNPTIFPVFFRANEAKRGIHTDSVTGCYVTWVVSASASIIPTHFMPDAIPATTLLIMVALCNRADHYIFILFLLLLLLLVSFFSSPNLSGQRLDAYDTSTHGVALDLECRSEMCCTRLAQNTGHKKVAKNCRLGTIAQLCRTISLQLRHISTIGKKLVKHQYVLHMSS